MDLWTKALDFVDGAASGRTKVTMHTYMTAYTNAFYATVQIGPDDAPAMMDSMRATCKKWAGNERFGALLPKIFSLAERGVRFLDKPSEVYRREVSARRREAARVVKRGLWRAVQRKRQMELLHELHKPGGLGARRAKERFEIAIKNF